MPIERGSAARAQAIGRVLIYGSLLGMAAFYLMPLWVMVTTSLKSLDEIYGGSFIGLPRAVDHTLRSEDRGGGERPLRQQADLHRDALA